MCWWIWEREEWKASMQREIEWKRYLRWTYKARVVVVYRRQRCAFSIFWLLPCLVGRERERERFTLWKVGDNQLRRLDMGNMQNTQTLSPWQSCQQTKLVCLHLLHSMHSKLKVKQKHTLLTWEGERICSTKTNWMTQFDSLRPTRACFVW